MAEKKAVKKQPRVEKTITTDVESVKQTVALLKPGMTVRIHQKIKELNTKNEEKERVQYFEGIIIARKNNKLTGGTITVRKVSDGVGVEKIFPLTLPTITKIEMKKEAEVNRAKLYFLKRGYKKKLKEKKLA
ncbi:MAG: 50S ribosomal protein L19 [Parcubacteria group bacterium GW2011_GWE2_39_37]|nr:MAG: 50S ribosomal protein L19 [Parcubacteria group bacterium GW2011_GWE2_39_37]